MDASQHKDYVLVLLFIKYVIDKFAGQPYAPITIPQGASFKDMVALKGKRSTCAIHSWGPGLSTRCGPHSTPQARAGHHEVELDADRTYMLFAAGLDAKGAHCEEKPQRLRPEAHVPVDGFPGLTSVTTRPNSKTIRAEAKRKDARSPVKAPMSWPTADRR